MSCDDRLASTTLPSLNWQSRRGCHRWGLRILGGIVQVAASVTRVMAVAVLKAATAARDIVDAPEQGS